MDKISREVATQEIEAWLDFKKVGEKKRETYKDNIETIVEAMMEGYLLMDKDKNLVQTLKFPIEGEMPISKLEYKPRLKLGSAHNHLQGMKSADAHGMILAYVAALTSKPKDIIKALDTEDTGIGQAIAIFFL